MDDGLVKTGDIPVEIIKALLKVQKGLCPLLKSADNTSFDSKFTPLPEVMTAALSLLNKQGLIVVQSPTLTDEGQSAFRTTLAHRSGATYTEVTKLAIEKINPQSHASAITYMRRYQLMAMIGLTSEDDDDDGNKAAGLVLKVTDEQKERLTVLLGVMSFPAEQIARIMRNILTRDAASIAIIKYEKMASERMRDREAEGAALAVETTTHIEVTQESDRTVKERLQELSRTQGVIPKSLILGITGKPFLANCDAADLEVLGKTLNSIESGERELPNEWYAAGHPPTKAPAETTVEPLEPTA